MSKVTRRGQRYEDAERKVDVVVFKDGDIGVRLLLKKHPEDKALLRLTRKGAEVLSDYLSRVLNNDCEKWIEEQAEPHPMWSQVKP